MDKWEYKTIYIYSKDIDQLEKTLNKEGERGWEFVWKLQSGDFLLKRKKSDKLEKLLTYISQIIGMDEE